MSHLSFLVTGVVALAIIVGGPAGAQMVVVVDFPGEPGEIPEEIREQVFEIEIDPRQLERSAAPPPPTADLGQLSPINPSNYATATVLVEIRSPRGFFPPYRVEGRGRTAIAPGAGDFTTHDVGMGLTNVVAANPIINPRFDYDPSTSPKNIDDEPLFQGTVATLPLTPPRLWLYRTGGWFIGTSNTFLLNFAVGPQFFSPTGAETMRIQIAVRRT